MLDIYEQFFQCLRDENIVYSVFKSLEHLHEDLQGNRGDVDIWFSERDRIKCIQIALASGFFKVAWSSVRGVAFILTGWDAESDKKVLLHVHFSPIAVKKRSYIPLYFKYTYPPTPAIHKKTILQPSQAWIKNFEANRKALKTQSDFQLLKQILLRKRSLAELGFVFSLRETLRMYTTYFRRFFIHRGKYAISRRGLLVAFVGIDGSGKSTAVKNISSASFLKTTQGVKVAYFGNKNFWIPGLEKALSKQGSTATVRKIFLMTLSGIDIKLRVVPVFIARLRGRVVLCDRYFYDQNIADPTEKYIKSKTIRRIVNPFVQWMPIRPDITFYLHVGPSIAFKRKQDYEFEKVEHMCAAYDALLLKDKTITVIDANQSVEHVLRGLRSKLVSTYKSLAKD